MKAVKRCAQAVRQALKTEGITVLQLNGKASDQIIPHLHVHIMPRWHNDRLSVSQWEIKEGDREELQEIARKVQDNVY
jgi:histidine triad (HIT) family protein